MSKAIDDVAAERARQIETEGWTPEHDAEHGTGQLSAAALGYIQSALSEIGKPHFSLRRDGPPAFWPWEDHWFKPTGARGDLVKAGALIVAEIERLDRAHKGAS